jgi:hypothetical protein
MDLVTRSDFDGLTCAVLLKEVEIIDNITFVHPNDIQDKTYVVTRNDILTNLPYHPNCGLWFDHHVSEAEREGAPTHYEGRCEVAPSAARVVCNHYKSHRFLKYEYLVAEVDRADAALLTEKDVLEPSGWILLSYILDPRTGLGKDQDFGISNRDMMYKMIDLIGKFSADEILAMHDVKQRVKVYFEEQEAFKSMLECNSRQDGNIVLTDTRGLAKMPTGNRFLIYTLFPETNISVRVMDGKMGLNTAVAIGHSIFNRTSKTNIGKLCAKYGGGGHKGAGTAQFMLEEADGKIQEIIKQIKADG